VILAEIILLSVTLTLSAALTGFVFGTISGFTRPALITAQGAICTSGSGALTCTTNLLNLGSGNTQTGTVCILKAGGFSLTGTVTSGGTIVAGSHLGGVTCTATGADIRVGSSVSGTILLSNGFVTFFVAQIQ
jgi:hypothetical protein